MHKIKPMMGIAAVVVHGYHNGSHPNFAFAFFRNFCDAKVNLFVFVVLVLSVVAG